MEPTTPQVPSHIPMSMSELPLSARSPIPKVIGIMMIIFGALGFFSGGFGLIGAGSSIEFAGAMATFNKASKGFDLLTVALSALQFFAGIKCLGYKDNGPKLAMTYGIAKIVTTVTWAALVFLWLKPMLSRFGGATGAMIGVGMMFGIVINLAWAIVVLALMTRPSTKQACTNF